LAFCSKDWGHWMVCNRGSPQMVWWLGTCCPGIGSHTPVHLILFALDTLILTWLWALYREYGAIFIVIYPGCGLLVVSCSLLQESTICWLSSCEGSKMALSEIPGHHLPR
jgi:hypothetical protein